MFWPKFHKINIIEAWVQLDCNNNNNNTKHYTCASLNKEINNHYTRKIQILFGEFYSKMRVEKGDLKHIISNRIPQVF